MMMTSDKILIGYDRNKLNNFGSKIPVYWDFYRSPHILVVGSTGVGKTVLCSQIIARIGLHIENSSVTVCDFKKFDFKYLNGAKNYYGFMDCKLGLDNFFTSFQDAQNNSNNIKEYPFKLLYFDEWTSFQSCLPKREAEEYKEKLAVLTMLSRAYNYHIFVSVQRGDSYQFGSFRDNYDILSLGNLSREQRNMFYSGFDQEEMPPVQNVGEGYALFRSSELVPIKTPYVRDTQKMEHYIKLVVNR